MLCIVCILFPKREVSYNAPCCYRSTCFSLDNAAQGINIACLAIQSNASGETGLRYAEVGIFKRKQESNKTRKHAFDHEIDQEKKKTRSRPRKRPRKKEKLSLFFLVFFYKFSPQITATKISCEVNETIIIQPADQPNV